MRSLACLSFLIPLVSITQAFSFGPLPKGWSGKAAFKVSGSTGVAAMMLTVTENDKVVILDRVEANPLKKNGNVVWASELTLSNNKVRPLHLQTNSFCAGGSFLGNGDLVVLGGDPYTGYGAQNGLQGLRLFTPCTNNKCEVRENVAKTHLNTPRWYPGVTRIQDGSVLIAGGVSETTYMTDNPTIEFYPPKGNGQSIYSPFLHNALPWNLFPHIYTLPQYGSKVFMASDSKAMIYDWKTNSQQSLPDLPNNQVVTYPFSAAGALLPLRASNGYQPEVIFCGGTQIKPGQGSSPETKASDQCSRLVLTPDGIAKGWKTEKMPKRRLMGNFIYTPDGKLVLLNGAGSGAAGYFNTINSQTKAYSSADNPVTTPYLYDPDALAGKRWSDLGTRSKINRMYHSVASLLPDGRIIVAGSNPNPNFEYGGRFPSELRVDYLLPPYLSKAAPVVSSVPKQIGFGQTFKVGFQLPSGANKSTLIVSLVDLGFSTHGGQYSQRYVQLQTSLSADSKTLSITAPPNTNVYPKGPAWLFAVVDGVPSVGVKVLVA